MPQELVKAHQALDKAVDAAYGRSFASDAERAAFLFGLYEQTTSLFPTKAIMTSQGTKNYFFILP